MMSVETYGIMTINLGNVNDMHPMERKAENKIKMCLARAGGAVRRSERLFRFPIASCLQGTILAPTTARLPTAGSVAHGHAAFWLRAAATSCRGEMNDRDEP